MHDSRLVATMLVCIALAFAGCYAKHFPQNSDTPTAYRTATPIPLVIGVVRDGEDPETNVKRIQVDSVVTAFAHQLESARVFKAVIYPYTELAPVEPDLLFRVKVHSRYDRMEVKNFFRQVLAGGTLLLLQPALPVQWDLTVSLAALASHPTAGWSKKYKARSTYRFESTWAQPSLESIQSWNDDTYRDAVRRLVAQITRDQELRRVGSEREKKMGLPQ